MSNLKLQPVHGGDFHSEFAQLASEYSRFVTEAGVPCSPFRSPQLPHFSSLTLERQEQALLDIRLALEVFQEMASAGQSLRDSPKLLWRSLRRLGITPCSDIFEKIGDEDVVSVYSIEHKQTFQNLRFLELVSLTIEEIYCTEWYKYSERPKWAEQALYEAANSMFSGKITNTLDPGVEEHLAREVNTEGNVHLWVKVKWISPVRRGEQVVGLIAVNRCTLAAPGDVFRAD